MRDICQNATEVLIWLGTGKMNGNEELAMDLVPYLAAASKVPTATVEQLLESADLRILILFTTQVCASHSIQQKPNEATSTVFTALFELLELPWFTRTWIVQEVAVASDAILWLVQNQFVGRFCRGLCILLQAAQPYAARKAGVCIRSALGVPSSAVRFSARIAGSSASTPKLWSK